MKKKRVIMTMVVLRMVVMGMILTGCGAHSMSPAGEVDQVAGKTATREDLRVGEDPLNHPAQSLGLRVIPEDSSGNQSTLPNPQASLQTRTILDDYTADSTDLILHTKLFLADPQSLNPAKRLEYFFVWPENSLGSPIASATYSHRFQTSNGRWVGNLKSKLVWHDTQNHRWFVPLSDIFSSGSAYQIANVNLEDTQVLSLELTLENGRHLMIDVKFQVSGPLPMTQLAPLNPPSPAQIESFIRDTSKSGWVVQKEEVLNPTARPFHIWVRHQAIPGTLKLNSHLQVPTYIASSDSPPQGPNFETYSSSGNLVLDELEVEHQNNQGNRIETVGLFPNTWHRITLEPSEKIVLNWKAHPAPLVVPCSVPPVQSQTYTWTTVSQTPIPPPHQTVVVNLPPIGGMAGQILRGPVVIPPLLRNTAPLPAPAAPVPHSITHNLAWSFYGAQITGQWDREIRLVHPFTSAADATQDPSNSSSPIEYVTLGKATVQTNISIGNIPGPTHNFSCQGVFP